MVGRRASRIALVNGYFPLTRSDKDDGVKELALVSHIVHMIESAAHGQLDRIIAVDLHAKQEVILGSKLGLITEVSMARPLLERVVEDCNRDYPELPICLLFPDEGAIKRFESAMNDVFKKIGIDLPIVCGQKRRQDSHSTKLLGLIGDVDKLSNSVVIGFDDEAATLKTNNSTARVVKEDYGAQKYISATVHGVLCRGATDDGAIKILMDPQSPIDRAYITDTIPPYNRESLKIFLQTGKIQVVSWAKDAANIIYYHHWDREIRELR